MRLLALLAPLVLLAGPAAAQRTCDKTTMSATTVPIPAPSERVVGVPGKRVYLCGYVIMPSANPPNAIEFELTHGMARGDCGAARKVLVPRMTVPASGIVNRVAYASGETSDQGASVCVQTFGTGGTLTTIFYWAQF